MYQESIPAADSVSSAGGFTLEGCIRTPKEYQHLKSELMRSKRVNRQKIKYQSFKLDLVFSSKICCDFVSWDKSFKYYFLQFNLLYNEK